jgi:hypothetical protein
MFDGLLLLSLLLWVMRAVERGAISVEMVALSMAALAALAGVFRGMGMSLPRLDVPDCRSGRLTPHLPDLEHRRLRLADGWPFFWHCSRC